MNKSIVENKLIYNLDRVIGEKKPITADIFLTNYCNNKCPYCTYCRWGDFKTQNRYISYSDFVIMIQKLLDFGIRGFILTGGGEPTINPDFNLITEFLEHRKISYGINTNFVEYKEISPTYLKVSLDAYSREGYINKRGVNKYSQVIGNIKKYIMWKKKHGINTNIGIQLLVTEPEEIKSFYQEHKSLDVDYIVFRPYESTQGEYYNSVSREKVFKILLTLEEYARKDNRIVINYKWFNLDVKFDRCYAHWSQMAINEKLEIMYCCHKPYEVICNIQDKDAFQKWKNATTDIKKCDIPCRLTGPNKFMKEVENKNFNSEFV